MVEIFHKYKIHALNVNSIVKVQKRHFLMEYIQRHKPDFLLLSETCLKEKHRFNIDGYEFVRTDAAQGARGTGILIKGNIDFKIFKFTYPTNFEYTAIILKSGNTKFYIFSIYIHANQLNNVDDLSHPFDRFASDEFLLLGGDFNAKHSHWQNYNHNKNGIVLDTFLDANRNFARYKLICSSLPTRIMDSSFSYIDLFLLSNNIFADDKARTYPFESDHLAIELFITVPVLETNEPNLVLNFSKTKWAAVNKELFNVLLQNMPPVYQNISTTEIEELVNFIEEKTLLIVSKHTPVVVQHSCYNMILNELTLKCIRERKVLRRRWFRGGRNNPLLKSLINRLTGIIAQLIAKQYSEKLTNDFKRMKPGPRVFKDIRKFSGNNRSQPPTLINCDNDESSAELLGGYFAGVHNDSPAALASNDECPPNKIIQDMLSTPPQPLCNFSECFLADGSSATSDVPFVDMNFVKSIIKSRKNQKSRGENQVSNFIIRKLPQIFVLFVTILINHCLNMSYFPLKWRHATIVPVPKGSSFTADHREYRPISLLSPISKLYELVIKKHLNKFTNALGVSNPYQFGFVAGKSISHAITVVSEDIHAASHLKAPILAVSIDLKKAFDSVWISGLIFKMRLLKFPPYLLHIILLFLSNRTFKVRFKNKLSSVFRILAGVPQGSILGPLLFNIYIADFPSFVDRQIKVILYADDILIYIAKKHIPTAIAKIEEFLKILMEYLNLWKLTVNFNKCQSILFRKSDSHITKSCKKFKTCSNLKISFDGHLIQNDTNMKYLGVILNNKLSVIPHVKRIRFIFNAAFFSLRNIFGNSKISTETKVLAYKQLLRPLLIFGFVGWCHISANQMRIIRTMERKVLYKCLPRNVAYIKVDNHWKLIPKLSLFRELPEVKRLDEILVSTFIKFFAGLEFSDLLELVNLTSVNFLNEKYDRNIDKYKFKCFPPSLLYHCYLQNFLHNNNVLTFYNRRFNAINLDSFVYDLIVPD